MNKEAAISRINNLSLGQTWMVSLILCALYWGMMYDDGSKLEQQIKTNQTQIGQAQRDLQSMAQAEEDAKRYRKAMEQAGERLDKIVKYVPAKLSDFDLMGILSTEAKAAGANISNVTAKGVAKPSNAVYEEVSVDVILEASYTQVLLFLSYLTRTDKIITLRQVNLSRTEESSVDGESLIKFQGIFVGYRYAGEAQSGGVN